MQFASRKYFRFCTVLENCAKLAVYVGDRDSTLTLLSVLQDNGLQPLYKAAYVMTASVQVNL